MVVSCGGDLTVVTVGERMPELLAALPDSADPDDAGADLDLDLSAVEEVDTAGLQLLLLLKREAAARSRRLRLAPAGEPVTRLLALAHLDLDLEPLHSTTPEGAR